MPLYVYVCDNCEVEVEKYSSKYVASEDDPGFACIECEERGETGTLKREEISETQPPNCEGGYQMHAIMSDGSRVPGSFGKSARTNKPSHRGKMISRKGEKSAKRPR